MCFISSQESGVKETLKFSLQVLWNSHIETPYNLREVDGIVTLDPMNTISAY